MRSIAKWVLAIVVCLFCALPFQAQQPDQGATRADDSAAPPAVPLIGVTSSSKNPLQIAILRLV
jgi:hypothetical protein